MFSTYMYIYIYPSMFEKGLFLEFPLCVYYLRTLSHMVQDHSEPIMCSYKAVKVFFEVWGLQSKVESGVHRVSGGICHTSTNVYTYIYMYMLLTQSVIVTKIIDLYLQSRFSWEQKQTLVLCILAIFLLLCRSCVFSIETLACTAMHNRLTHIMENAPIYVRILLLPSVL